jgi:hypothetical protein
MARSAVACALLGSVFWSPASQAALSPTIEWDAPTTCPNARALHERLSALLGHEPAGSETLLVRGVVVQAGEDLRLTLEVATATRRNSRVFVARLRRPARGGSSRHRSGRPRERLARSDAARSRKPAAAGS